MDSVRDDGTYTLYQVEHDYECRGKEWSVTGENSMIAAIPQELRWIDPSVGKHTPLFQEYFDTWQWSGIHGWRSEESVLAVLHLVAKYNPQHRFRAVRRTFSRLTEPFAEMRALGASK